LGQTARATDLLEQALAIAREIGDRSNEGVALGKLAYRYSDLGQTARAIDLLEQALAIAREIGDRSNEGYWLNILADCFSDNGDYRQAVQQARAAVEISEETQEPRLESYCRGSLALAYLLTGRIAEARSAAEAARKCEVPENDHCILTLSGVIALREDDRAAAFQTFTSAVTETDRMLALSSGNYEVLDSKALALCGLALCGKSDRLPAAVEAYRAARKINRDAGVVKRVLRLLDALAVVDTQGVLAEVRAAAAGEA
jgi:tetratricopeptide (TPR) repeat protein